MEKLSQSRTRRVDILVSDWLFDWLGRSTYCGHDKDTGSYHPYHSDKSSHSGSSKEIVRFHYGSSLDCVVQGGTL